jgi:multidrug resistance efflux pump
LQGGSRGNVVTLPTRYNLDQLGRYAALTIMAVELARLAVQGDADEMEITLNGERQWLDRAAMLAIAQDMLEQRQAIADAGAGLVERVAHATATMGQAEAMLAACTERA